MDNLHTVKSYQYNIATGAYTISFQGNRHFLGIDPTTGIQWEQVTHSSGGASGIWPLIQQTLHINALDPSKTAPNRVFPGDTALRMVKATAEVTEQNGQLVQVLSKWTSQ
jgi:hypothetical protein